jgi:micrococcal nuclease
VAWIRRVWTGFRGWPLWAQIVTGVFALIVVAGSLPSDEEGIDVATSATTTTTTPTTTVPTTTTTTTTTLPPGVPAGGEDTTVSSITDGDTLRVANGDAIRLIGVDAPESTACFAAEATARLRELLPPGTRVRLSYDAERRDSFQRTLAYVYRLGDGLFVNAAMAREGFVKQLAVAPNVAKAEEFAAAVTEARNADRGLWAACQATTTRATTPPTTAAPSPPRTTTPLPVVGGSCSPAYPDVCIPPPPPDLDCGDISHRRFRVLSPDPHRFDGSDDDGLGCESG